MKTLLAVVFFSLPVLSLPAQDTDGFEEAFARYAHRRDAVSFTLTKTLLDVVDLDLEWEEQIRHVTGDIYQVRFILFDEDDRHAMIVQNFAQHIRDLGYETIRFEDDELKDLQYFKVFGKRSKGYYHQLHVLLRDEDGRAYFFSVDGKLRVSHTL